VSAATKLVQLGLKFGHAYIIVSYRWSHWFARSDFW